MDCSETIFGYADEERQKLLAGSSSLLGESVQGIQVVKAFANEDNEVKRYKQFFLELFAL